MILFFVGHCRCKCLSECTRSDLQRHDNSKFSWGSMPTDPLACGRLCPPPTVIHLGVTQTHNLPIIKFLDPPLLRYILSERKAEVTVYQTVSPTKYNTSTATYSVPDCAIQGHRLCSITKIQSQLELSRAHTQRAVLCSTASMYYIM